MEGLNALFSFGFESLGAGEAAETLCFSQKFMRMPLKPDVFLRFLVDPCQERGEPLRRLAFRARSVWKA